MKTEIPTFEQMAAIKSVRASAHEVVAATNRLHAELLRVLPRGTRVKVFGWKGTVESYYMPLEGELSVRPDDMTQTSGYLLGPKDSGCVMVHVDRVELIEDEVD